MGRWGMDKDAIQLFRQAVADDRKGAELQKLVDKLQAEGFPAHTFRDGVVSCVARILGEGGSGDEGEYTKEG